jgi:putative DNA primase/helicase
MHDRIRSALTAIPADLERRFWIRIGCAIKSELGDDGFYLWDEWSLTAAGYNAKDAKSAWKSIKADGPGAVGLGTLIYEAKQRGWTEDTKYKPPTKDEIEARQAARRAREAEQALLDAQLAAAAAEFALDLWENKSRPADDHPYLQRKGVKSYGLRVGPWYRLDEDPDPETGEVTQKLVEVTKNGLYVPMRDRTGKLHSLQCISQKPDGGKRYLKDGAKRGHFFAVGSKPLQQDGRPVFCLGEGYATCASAHEATGHLVLTCFDTSNLPTVAKAIRERVPSAIIIMLADNDQDDPKNPGLSTARKVAQEVGALVAVPVLADAPEQRCDFNDLHLADGPEAVAAAIAGAKPYEETPAAPEPDPAAAALPDMPEPPQDIPPAPIPIDEPRQDFDEDEIANNGHFSILGYNQNDFYIFSDAKRQICVLTKSDMNVTALLEYAPLNFWEMYFPARTKGQSKFDTNLAAEWLFGVAHRRGIYDPSRVRGRGAWIDKNRSVYHHGGYLTVDGVKTDITSISSAYVYPMASDLLTEHKDAQAMTDEEGRWLLKVAGMARWNKPGSAALLAGWAMLAPICGALTWRSHIWLTGEAGSGKSTIQNKFAGALLRDISLHANGDSTEAGIRQNLKADALPVLIDELESNDETDKRRVAGMIALIRKTSTESQAQTFKGTPTGDGNTFRIRSMFCLASINTNFPGGQADVDRLTVLALKTPSNPVTPEQAQQWDSLEAELNKIDGDPEISSRLLNRALSMMPTILATLKVFRRVAAKRFGRQRDGDQLGTLMAGAWCLTSKAVPTDEQALKLIDYYDWEEHANDGSNADDPTKALGAILDAKLRVNHVDYSVYEIAEVAARGAGSPGLHHEECVAILRRNGIRIERTDEGQFLVVSNNSAAITDLVAKTPYSTNLRGQLLRVPGASKMDNQSFKFNGITSKAVGIPMNLILEPDNGLPI